MMMTTRNLLSYAGCLHRFVINEHGYIQIDLFEYDQSMERFERIHEKSFIPSMTMKFTNDCFIVGSTLIEKGLGVLLQLHTVNSSILMFLQLQSRPPRSCQIIYTLSHSTFLSGSMKCLAMNSSLTLFIDQDNLSKEFYLIDNTLEQSQRKIQSISCLLSTYIYCYLKGNSYWLLGSEIDRNTKRKFIQVYYGLFNSPSTSLLTFTTDKFIPLSLVDNIETIHVIDHQLQLKSRRILADVLLSTHDHRILSCHHGMIIHELIMPSLITSIQSYLTIENEQLFLFSNKDHPSIEIFHYDEQRHLNSYVHSHQTGTCILLDDFTQIGWKQILFLKNSSNFHSFILTDFSQIHIFQQEFDDENEYHLTEDKRSSMDIDDTDIQQSLCLVRNILRKKIINAEFIINEGYFQCKQIENNIRKITSKYPILNLQNHSDNLSQNSDSTTSIVQLIETNWFTIQSTLYLYITMKNTSNLTLSTVSLFAVDKSSTKFQVFSLRLISPSLLNEQTNNHFNPQSTMMFVLTTAIELEKDINFELYLFVDGSSKKLYHIDSLVITLDDLIHSNNRRILKLHTLEQQSKENFLGEQGWIYLKTFFRLMIKIQSTTTSTFIEHFRQLLSITDFQTMIDQSNVYIRINEGSIFDNVLIHLVNEDDLIIHFYAKDWYQTTMLAKYILSKLDFQTFSIIDSITDTSDEETRQRIDLELTGYLNRLKDLPTIMRKLAPTSKSESYRLLKLEDFQFFENERHLTDLFLTSLMID